MENWFKDVGRPALFDALAGACDRINNALDEELKSRIAENTRLSTELEHLKSRVSNVDQLREENRSLQREIQNLKDNSRNSRLPLAPKSVNQVSDPKRFVESGKSKIDELKLSELKEEHLKLGGNYGKLREKYSELEDAHTKLNRRLRDMTKAYNQWMDHANQLNELCQRRSRTIKNLEAKLEITTVGTSIPFNPSFSSNGSVPPERRQLTTTSKLAESNTPNGHKLIRPKSISSESPLLWPPTNENSFGHESLRSTVSTSPELAKIVNRIRFDHGRDVTVHSNGHISTQDGEEASLPPLPHDQGAALDEVLIKHEPSSDAPVVVFERCLRKRKHGDDQVGDSRAVVRLKAEEDDSGPRITDEHRQFVPHESIDFDAEGGRVDTPRKRSRINPEFEGISSLDNPWSHADNDDLDDHCDLAQAASTRGRSPTNALQANPSTVLKLSGRGTVPQRPKASLLARRNELSFLYNGISSLAEDGDQDETPKTNTKKMPKTGRLRHLLNNPIPTHETTSPTKSVLSDQVNASAILESPIPQRRGLLIGKSELMPFERRVKRTIGPPIIPETTNRRASTNTTAKQSTNRRTERRLTDSAASDATPLRERPKSQLGIKDFKINPDANEGYDFAFTDVVRNKNERASLTGCVQEGCCGQTFRLQARVQRGQTSTPDFQALLEKYLGDDAWKLSTMTKPEKEELWLDAKTQELANEHGKHRHRFHRAASPAGYWRTDFPSTQEEQRDKEQAVMMARQAVEERYREAMRPGGRWLFRDE